MEKSICLYNFNVKNIGAASLDLFIDGEIVTAETEDIYKEYWNDTTSVSFRTIRNTILENNPSVVNIYINSPGGNVTEAMATHDFIVELQNKGVIVNGYGYGLIASSSTYILSACKNSHISKNSFYMIHDLSGGVWGTMKDIKNYYDTMVTFDSLVKDFYSNLTGQTKEQITQWMDSETYFNGTDAVKYGFVKNLTTDVEFTNKLKSENFQFKNNEVVSLYNSLVKNNNPKTDDDMTLVEKIVNALKEGGFIGNKAGEAPTVVTVEALTNSLTEAFKDFKLEPAEVTEEQLTNSITNFLKDGLPEGILNQITEQVTTVVTEATKDLPTNTKIEELEETIEGLQEEIANKKGGAKPKNKGGDAGDDKNDHEGVSWG